MLLTRALHNAGVEDVTDTLLKEMRDLLMNIMQPQSKQAVIYSLTLKKPLKY